VKRWLIALATLALLSLICVPLALAAGHGKPQDKPRPDAPKGKVKFQCEATVIVSAGQSLTVTVTAGSKTVKAYRGKWLVVHVDPKAKLINATVDPSVPLTLGQLVAGAKVHLGGTIDRKTGSDTFTATKVILQKLPKAP
jgi:uncharacterized protein YdeI (BOF family)